MSKIWLVGFLIAVPVVGWLVAEGLQVRLNAQLRATARRQVRDAVPERLARVSVQALCETPTRDSAPLCEEYGWLDFMITASIATAVVGLALVILIAAAGAFARGNRDALVWVFRPGLYITAAVLTFLIVAHASILMGTLLFAETALLYRVPIGIILTIGVGALAGVIAVARSAFSVLRRAETSAFGTTISRGAAPDLWAAIETAATRLGALMPDKVVVGLDPNFFVTEADVVTMRERLSGRTLYVSLPLARILTVSEFTAIVGHELGHFRGEDTKFSKRFYPIYRGAGDALHGLQVAGGEGAGLLALLPAMAVFNFFLASFAVAESRLGRERELIADWAGASVTSARAMAASLVKVHTHAGVWKQVQSATIEGMRHGTMFANASRVFADAIVHGASRNAMATVSDVELAHPTDSHPPLSERLDSLGVSLASVKEAALQVSPVDHAATLIADVETVEEEITAAYQALTASRLGIDIAAARIERRAPVVRCEPCNSAVLPAPGHTCPHCGKPVKRSGTGEPATL